MQVKNEKIKIRKLEIIRKKKKMMKQKRYEIWINFVVTKMS